MVALSLKNGAADWCSEDVFVSAVGLMIGRKESERKGRIKAQISLIGFGEHGLLAEFAFINGNKISCK